MAQPVVSDADPAGDDLPEPGTDWRPDPEPSDAEMLLRGLGGLARKPGRAVLLSARTARELGRATRNPALVAAANQVRRGLRGPVGTVLNLGRDRGPDVEAVGPLPTLTPPRLGS